MPLSSTSIVQGQVPSMMEMHLDLLRELGSHLETWHLFLGYCAHM